MERLVEIVVGTNHELATHKRPFGSRELVFNISTRELRKGPGRWADMAPALTEDLIDLSVRVAVATNVTINTALQAGETLSGQVLAHGDRVLLMGQTDQSKNGPYVVGETPARAPGYETFEAHLGRVFHVQAGTLAGKHYTCTSSPGGILGTTALSFAVFGTPALEIGRDGQFAPLTMAPAPADMDKLLIEHANGRQEVITLAALKTYVNA